MTKEQRKALEALRDVMREHDIDLISCYDGTRIDINECEIFTHYSVDWKCIDIILDQEQSE